MKRVGIVGTGLIGGSIGLGLSRIEGGIEGGIEIVGFDDRPESLARAIELGAITRAARTLHEVAVCDVVFVAVPVGNVAKLAVTLLDAGAAVVTDVGSVKESVVEAVTRARPELASRFVGGHPMAGSELEGVDGSRADLFVGAVWALTPTATTDNAAFAAVRDLATALGAETIALDAAQHDQFVAYVSHVPQLASSALMRIAATQAQEHRTLLRLAAGGFRDMTRIAAGNPTIWPDILLGNRNAVIDALDSLLSTLTDLRTQLAVGDRDALLQLLVDARVARRNLPIGAAPVEEIVVVLVPVRDRPGVLAEVTTLASRIGANIYDLAIAHSVEGDSGGVVELMVNVGAADELVAGLKALGYATTVRAV